MLRIVIMLFAALALSSCSGPCTLIGCSNVVRFQLGNAEQHFGLDEPVLVKACAGTQCAEETVTSNSIGSTASSSTGPAIMLSSGTLFFTFNAPVSGAVTVSLELRKNGAVVFGTTRDEVSFSTFQPNGPGCAPVCQQVTVSL